MQTKQELELKIKKLEATINLIQNFVNDAVLHCKNSVERTASTSDFEKGRLCQAELFQETLPHFLAVDNSKISV